MILRKKIMRKFSSRLKQRCHDNRWFWQAFCVGKNNGSHKARPWKSTMGPVRISHSSHHFGPVILWISLGGKPKWLPLKFGYHDVMRTSPIARGKRHLRDSAWTVKLFARLTELSVVWCPWHLREQSQFLAAQKSANYHWISWHCPFKSVRCHSWEKVGKAHFCVKFTMYNRSRSWINKKILLGEDQLLDHFGVNDIVGSLKKILQRIGSTLLLRHKRQTDRSNLSLSESENQIFYFCEAVVRPFGYVCMVQVFLVKRKKRKETIVQTG